jgi:hypothetical protein
MPSRVDHRTSSLRRWSIIGLCAASSVHFNVVAGRRHQLVGLIQQRCGFDQDDAENQVAEWQRHAPDAWFGDKSSPL